MLRTSDHLFRGEESGHISASGNIDIIQAMLPPAVFQHIIAQLESIVLASTSITVRKLEA